MLNRFSVSYTLNDDKNIIKIMIYGNVDKLADLASKIRHIEPCNQFVVEKRRNYDHISITPKLDTNNFSMDTILLIITAIKKTEKFNEFNTDVSPLLDWLSTKQKILITEGNQFNYALKHNNVYYHINFELHNNKLKSVNIINPDKTNDKAFVTITSDINYLKGRLRSKPDYSAFTVSKDSEVISITPDTYNDPLFTEMNVISMFCRVNAFDVVVVFKKKEQNNNTTEHNNNTTEQNNNNHVAASVTNRPPMLSTHSSTIFTKPKAMSLDFIVSEVTDQLPDQERPVKKPRVYYF